MSSKEECVFCDLAGLRSRTIAIGDGVYSLVSNPSFRENHCLVIPRRHIETSRELEEIDNITSGAILREVGRLSVLLDTGFGVSTLQKFDSPNIGNGVTQAHLHYHVFPRVSPDELFGAPTDFDEFKSISQQQIDETLKQVRPNQR